MPINTSMESNKQYVLSISYGKDSLACLGAIEKLGLPLDRIVHAEVWATQDIPADLPPMVEFKKKADKIIKDRWGIEVEHFCAIKKPNRERESNRRRGVAGNGLTSATSTDNAAEEIAQTKSKDSQLPSVATPGANNSNSMPLGYVKLTYEDIFYRPMGKRRQEREREREFTVSQSSRGNGATPTSNVKPFGWANIKCPYCTGELKRTALRFSHLPKGQLVYRTQARPNQEFSKMPREQGAKINTVQYIGIAEDEPKRLERLDGITKISPLHLIGWTEADCMQWCIENDLCSPLYDMSNRGGCWFCHNQGIDQMRYLRKNYPDLWALLMKWDLDSPVTFKADGHTVHDFDKRFQLEDDGIIDPNVRWRWKYLTEPPAKQLNLFEIGENKE